MALPRLELKPGEPLPVLSNRIGDGQPQHELETLIISVSDFWKAVISFAVLVGVIYVCYRLLRDSTWNWLNGIQSFVLAGGLVLIAGCLIWALLSGANSSVDPIAVPLPPASGRQIGEPLGPLPLYLIWIAALGVAAIFVGVGLWVIFRPTGRGTSDEISLQAVWALQALKKGLDPKNVIVQCYWQMAQVLQEEQGIERKMAMTVREFERLLEDRGMPSLPVHQLTQLFESVRYGHREVSAEEERRAIDALTAIVEYSQATRG